MFGSESLISFMITGKKLLAYSSNYICYRRIRKGNTTPLFNPEILSYPEIPQCVIKNLNLHRIAAPPTGSSIVVVTWSLLHRLMTVKAGLRIVIPIGWPFSNAIGPNGVNVNHHIKLTYGMFENFEIWLMKRKNFKEDWWVWTTCLNAKGTMTSSAGCLISDVCQQILLRTGKMVVEPQEKL